MDDGESPYGQVGEKGRTDRQTEIWRRGQTMKKNIQEDWRRTGERHGSWFHVREEASTPERDRQ